MKGFVRTGLILLLLATCRCQPAAEQAPATTGMPAIVPAPAKVLKRQGTLTLNRKFYILADMSDSLASTLAARLKKELEKITGPYIEVADRFTDRNFRQTITLLQEAGRTPVQGYELVLTSGQIKLTAHDEQGLFYGIQTLLQLLRQTRQPDKTFVLPRLIIRDQPAWPVRGILLQADSLPAGLPGRMARLKLNTLACYPGTRMAYRSRQLLARNHIALLDATNLPAGLWLTDSLPLLPASGANSAGILLRTASPSDHDLELLARTTWERNEPDTRTP